MESLLSFFELIIHGLRTPTLGFIGSSTSIGTPICIAIGIPLFTELASRVF